MQRISCNSRLQLARIARDRLYRIYADATNQSIDRIAKDCDRNKWLDEQEMLDYGLIDRVLTKMPVMKTTAQPDSDG